MDIPEKENLGEVQRFSDNSIRFDSEFTDKVMKDGGRLGTQAQWMLCERPMFFLVVEWC